MIRTERRDEGVVLRLQGTFDDAEAWRVHETLGKLPPEIRVSLDFREVRAFHDFAIARLARDLLNSRGRVKANGLCQHERRLLEYLGVDESGLGQPGAGEASGPKVPGEDLAEHLGL